MTLNTLIRDIFDACNIPLLRDYSEIANNKDYRLVRQYLNDTARDVSLKYDFAVQEKQFELDFAHLQYYLDREGNQIDKNTDVDSELLDTMVFILPPDFDRLPRRHNISYNREQFTTGIPITNQQQWQIWTEFGYSYRNRFRLIGMPDAYQLEIQPVFRFVDGQPQEHISFSYMSKNWLKDSTDNEFDSVGTDFTLTPILDEQILKFGAIYQYKINRGEFQVASVWKDRYDKRIRQIQHDQRPQTFIAMGGNKPGGLGDEQDSDDYFLPYYVQVS